MSGETNGAERNRGWIARVGAAHALIGLTVLFLTLHPLRDALDAHALALVQTMTAIEAISGVALLALAPRFTGWLVPGLIAGGVAASTAMIFLIAFTGLHPFDPMVPLGGLAMIAGWIMVLIGKGID